ncbi:MAG TPA: TetR/AcrR family transcriptional regulator C-terminal domain-containing protein [Streptosporangiaceae bacterium]|jgi:AcrR family transcriptional regulator
MTGNGGQARRGRQGHALVWARQQPSRRPPLTREAIVEAAITVADAEGLDAVSLRRVSAELGARTMSLYSHIASKQDLLDLMLDEILGEFIVPGKIPADWRAALRGIARQSRATGLRHPWLGALIAQRPRLGPNGIAHAEQSLAALASLAVDDQTKRVILTTVDDYTLGRVQREIAALELPKRQGVTDSTWRAEAAAYLERVVASGEYPYLAGAGGTSIIGEQDPERTFEAGLDLLIAGVATTVAAG